MKERPILFSAPMVRAILAGTKTQTRRVSGLDVINAEPDRYRYLGMVSGPGEPHFAFHDERTGAQTLVRCRNGQPGDRLWVRETHAIVPRTAYRCSEGVQQVLRPDDDHDAAIYREGWTRSRSGFRWRPSIHMPRWASRITLEITEVRVERLQDISEGDALAEGYASDPTPNDFALPWYRRLWEQINGPGSWEANPWVWAVSFKRVEAA